MCRDQEARGLVKAGGRGERSPQLVGLNRGESRRGELGRGLVGGVSGQQ